MFQNQIHIVTSYYLVVKNFLSVACKKIHAQFIADPLAMLHEGLFSIKYIIQIIRIPLEFEKARQQQSMNVFILVYIFSSS